ncbi:TonB-dependent receptor [Methylobacillus gramineus]|uniref:TonB-dependent siderophore receptor n=1 Tax=Methylobacillus gramineus TaxID=755169 RepID=UPI001CFF557C|nr:TonB-dependent receptor [Methylobacillus gramineus]MCB5185752.1 TonB-dependent receptor [Methylobacillus gramineus]
MQFSSSTTFSLSPIILALQLAFIPAAAMVTPSVAYADNAAANVQYDIPAGPLAPALTKFAQQSGIAVSVDAQNLKGLNTKGVKGTYSIEDGFNLLLAGTGYAPEKTSAGYALRKATQLREESTHSSSTALPEVTVMAALDRDSRAMSEGTRSYAARAVTIGKGEQSLRETPQSVTVVTRQRMDDQNLTTLDSVLMQTTGVTKQLRGYGHSTYASRGFEISNYMLDGVPTGDYGGIGTAPDTIILDRIEVMRGAPGLIIGNGDPGGTVNMVRKRPLAEKQIQITARAGSWDYYRLDGDVTGPLNESGTLRGRLVAGYEDRHYFHDEAQSKLPVVYGILEADLGRHTVAAVGIRYQDYQQDGGRWRGGLPMSIDGSNLNLSRSTSLGPSWTMYESKTKEIFGDVTHHFNDDWKIKLSAMHQRNDRDDLIIRTNDGLVNPQTMTGVAYNRVEFQKVQYETTALDAQVNGKFNGWGQTHELFLGANWQQNETPSTKSARTAYSPLYAINLDTLDLSQVPRLYRGAYGVPNSSKETRQGVYGNARLQLVDSLKLIVGGRVSWYEYESTFSAPYKQANEVTPYVALIFKINDEWSLYGSYTDIFKPQSNSFTASGSSLSPSTGTNYEAGIKGELYGGKLNTSFTVFRIVQDNYAITDPLNRNNCSPTGGACSINGGKMQSQGFEAEVNGEMRPGWQVSAGYTFNSAKYETAQFDSVNSNRLAGDHNPRQLLRLWNTYKLPGDLNRVSIGGGVFVQSETSYITGTNIRRQQSGYSVWSAQASYKIDDHWSAALNINNLFDKRYYLDALQTFYGEPQSVMLTVRGNF